MNNTVELTGKASIDKPWLKFYPEALREVQVPKMPLGDFLKMKNPNGDKIAFEYYGNVITWKSFWEEVEVAAKALAALGFKKGDRIPVFLLSCPSHFILLLAAEKIGAALICRDDIPEEICFAIRKSKSSIAFAHDFLSKADEELYRTTTPLRKIIKVSPYDYADRNSMVDYIEDEIESRYCAETEMTAGDLTWDEFMELGRNYKGEYLADIDPDRPLFGAYTSGSTGISKLVIHSAANIVAVAFQMSVFIPPMDHQERWWLPILPPALIAATVSMTIFPLSAGLKVMLDPYCPVEKLDVAFMEIKPNFWALIPMMCELLMKSKNIPDDYDMSHLRSIGTGAEAMNERKSREVEEFFHKHNCMATLSAGYGQSEGCSNFTLPNPMFPLKDGNVGMPMPATVMAVFDEETLEEKGYGEYGELCVYGPATMLHYSGWMGEEMTERTLIKHEDGKVWLHTGDIAYITEHGIVHILGRGHSRRYGGGELFMMRMESRLVEAEGVKDGFFCFIPDQEHEGFFVPYLFVVLDEGKTLEEVEPAILDALEEHEYPVEIRVIDERPYFHFKTNRRELTAEILEQLKSAPAKETGKMKVSWTQNEKATGYQICYSKKENFDDYKMVTVASQKKLQEIVGGLAEGIRYFVKVRAYNHLGTNTYYSAWSAVESIIHTVATLENGPSGIEVSWTKVKGASEYRVYRKKAGDENGFARIASINGTEKYIDTNVENGVRYYYYVIPQIAGVKAKTNVAFGMYLEAPCIEKLFNN